jgi:hypothetical protein
MSMTQPLLRGKALFDPTTRELVDEHRSPATGPQPFQEQHFPTSYWAGRWGFSAKTVREWFRDEYGPGILRQPNVGRRSKRDYTTIMVSASAAARVYARRSAKERIN